MEINPTDLHYRDVYKLLIGSVIPRPIAWVSSLGPDGQRNLAPYSFFTAVCPNPPTIVFCPNIRRLNAQEKDTLRNIKATGEFVVNIVSEEVAEAMNITSTEAPAEVDEFELAGLTAAPSKIVQVPRVAESPINMECKLAQIVTIGEELGQGSLVIGEVVYFHIADEVYVPDYKIEHTHSKQIARLSGSLYSRITEVFDLPRPPMQIPNTVDGDR